MEVQLAELVVTVEMDKVITNLILLDLVVQLVQLEDQVLVVLVEVLDQQYVQTKTEISLSTITLEDKSTPEVAEVDAEEMVVKADKVVLVEPVVMVVIPHTLDIFLNYKYQVTIVVPDSTLI